MKTTQQLQDKIGWLRECASEHSKLQNQILEIVSPHLGMERGQTINLYHCIEFLKNNLNKNA